MLNTKDVALYFINKDTDKKLFNMRLIHKNNRDFYEGNARINKYLQLAQNLYVAKTGKPLMNATFYAYDNGAVATEIQEDYAVLIQNKNFNSNVFDNEQLEFLDKFYKIFENADIDELIQLSHEDPAWIEKHNYYYKPDQKMDTLTHIEQYKDQYADIIKVMSRVNV